MLSLKKHISRSRLILPLILLGAAILGAPSVLAQGGPPDPPSQGPAGIGGGMAGPGRGRMASMMLRRRAMGSTGRMGGLLAALRRPEVQRELGLTEDQRKKLEDIAFNVAKARIEEQKNLELHRLELGRLMRADNADRAAIDKKLQEISQAQLALARAVTNAMLDGRVVLTKQQRDKLQQIIQRRQTERQQGTAPARPAGPPPTRGGPARPAEPATPPPPPR